MTKHPDPEKSSSPNLKIVGFQIWIHGREFPDATDYDDVNWLNITAHCGSAGASVWVKGPIIQIQDIHQLRSECEELLNGTEMTAALTPLEPELMLTIKTTDSLGHLEMSVHITPDHLNQEHIFRFEIDQSYLPGIIRQCKEIEKTYEIRGR
jgi:hypothetical protein